MVFKIYLNVTNVIPITTDIENTVYNVGIIIEFEKSL